MNLFWYQSELYKEIKNYFIDNNHINYILITSICNDQSLSNKELKKGEMNRKILKTSSTEYYGDIEDILMLIIIYNNIVIRK